MPRILIDTIDMLDTLRHNFEILQIYQSFFKDNLQMGQDLFSIFEEIILFWTRMIHFLRRNKTGA